MFQALYLNWPLKFKAVAQKFWGLDLVEQVLCIQKSAENVPFIAQ